MVNFFQDDTICATSKSQIIKLLTKFRVKKTSTLKTPKHLLYSVLQVALFVSSANYFQDNTSEEFRPKD